MQRKIMPCEVWKDLKQEEQDQIKEELFQVFMGIIYEQVRHSKTVPPTKNGGNICSPVNNPSGNIQSGKPGATVLAEAARIRARVERG